jgi:hypothetical protein
MPVFVNGVPRYEIKPPSTLGDKGEPTEFLQEDVRRLFCLIEDERHLTAHKLLQDIQRRIQEWEKSEASAASSDGGGPNAKRRRPRGLGGFGSKHKKEVVAAKEKQDKEMKETLDVLQSKHKEIEKLEVR